jgi:hypothetical protein
MRRLAYGMLFAGLAALPACTEPESSRSAAPPTIEGRVRSVSSADIRAVLDTVRAHLNHVSYPRPGAIHRVIVIDHNHIKVCYYVGGETCDQFERVEGQWIIPEVEREIVPGVNIPTE